MSTPSIAAQVQLSVKNNILLSWICVFGGLGITLFGLLAPEALFASSSLYVNLVVIAAAIGLPIYGLVNLIRNLRWKNRPYSHPAFNWSVVGSPQQVQAAIDEELRSPGVIRIGSVSLTSSWMIHADRWGVASVSLPALVWFYKQVTETKYYFVVTIRKTHSFVAWSRDGRKLQLKGIPERDVDGIAGELSQRVPWAIGGYSSQLDEAWRSRREEFLRAVDERRTPSAPEANPTLLSGFVLPKH